MKIIKTIKEYRQLSYQLAPNQRGFVPTMGALHEGHLSLIHQCRSQCVSTVVSIFVNPKQFAPHEDFKSYPRPWERDIELLKAAQIDVLFLPDAPALYPETFSTMIQPGPLANELEGAIRPDFFRGVCTVVGKLFNIIEPDVAYFGQKDLQQFKLVERLIQDLDWKTQLVMVETVREKDGLAMSSRNHYLNPSERQKAPNLYRALVQMANAAKAGNQSVNELTRLGREFLTAGGDFELQYLEIRRLPDLSKVTELSRNESYAILAAVKLGNTRLIDNLIIKPGR